MNFFTELVENDARKKSFFSDLAQLQSQPISQIQQALTARKATPDSAKRKMKGILAWTSQP